MTLRLVVPGRLRHPERSIQRQLMVFKHREGESKPKVRKKDDGLRCNAGAF
jgi:hypothetical protein